MNRFKRFEPTKKKKFPTRPRLSHNVSVVKGDVVSGFQYIYFVKCVSVPDIAPIKSLEKRMEINKQMEQVTQRIENVINNYVEESNREPLYELSDGTYGTAQLAVDESKGAATMLFVNFEKTGMTKEEVLMSIQKWFDSVKAGVRITADDNFTHDPDDPEIDEFIEDTEHSAEEMARIKDESTSHLTEIFSEAVKRARKLAIKLSGTQENEEVKQLVQEVQSLLTEGERLNKQIKDLQTQLDKSQREVMEMTTKQNEDFSAIRQRESEISSQLLDMSEELREAKHDKEVAEEKVTKLEAIFEQLQIEHAKEVEDAKSDKNNLHEREKQIEEAERNAKVAKDQLKAKEKENFNLQTQITHLEAQITQLNQAAIDKAREYQAETAANEAKYKEIQDTYIEQIDDLKQTLEELQVQSQFDKKNIENQEKIISENENQIRQNEIALEKLKDQLSELKKANHQQDTKFKELEDAKVKADADIEVYKQQIADLQTDLHASEKELKASKKELEEIKEALDKNTSLLNQYKNDTNSQLSDQNKLKNQVAKLKREIDDDHKEIESYKSDIESNKKQMTELRNHIKYLENELGKRRSEIHNLNGSLTQVVNDQRKSKMNGNNNNNNNNQPEPIQPPQQQQQQQQQATIQQQQEDDISTVVEMPSIEMVEQEINTDNSLFNPMEMMMIYDKNSKEDITCKEILSCYDASYQGIKYDADRSQFELYAHTDEDMMTDTDDMMMLKKEEYEKNLETEATRLAEPIYLRIKFLQKKRKQLENELSFYKNQEGKSEDQKIDELFTQINDLMAKKTDLEDVIINQTTQMSKVEDELNETLKELKEIKEKERATKDELCSIQKEHCKCKKIIDKLNADIEAANGAISTYKSRRNSRSSISSQPNMNSTMTMNDFSTLEVIPSEQSSPTHKQPPPQPKQTEEELIDEIRQLPQNLLAEELQKIANSEGNNGELTNEQMIQISSEIASNLENKLTSFLNNIDTQIYEMTNLIVDEDYYDNNNNNRYNSRDDENRDKVFIDDDNEKRAEINENGELIITTSTSTNTSNPPSPTKPFASRQSSHQVSPSHRVIQQEERRKSSFDLVINTNLANQQESLDENDLPTKSKLASALRKKVSSHSLLDFKSENSNSDKNSPTNYANMIMTTEADLDYYEFEGTDLIVNGMMYETNPILQLPSPAHHDPINYQPDYHLLPTTNSTTVTTEEPEVIESIKPKVIDTKKDNKDETLSSSSSDSYEGAQIYKEGESVVDSNKLSKNQRMLTANLCNIESMSFPIVYREGAETRYVYILPDGRELSAEEYEIYKKQLLQNNNNGRRRSSLTGSKRTSMIKTGGSGSGTGGIIKGRPSLIMPKQRQETLQQQQSSQLSEEAQTNRNYQPTVKDAQGREYIELKPGDKVKPGDNVVAGKDGKQYVEVKPEKKQQQPKLQRQPTIKDAQGREYTELRPGDKVKPNDNVVTGSDGKKYIEVKPEKKQKQPTIKDAQGREYVELKPGQKVKPGKKIVKDKNGKQYVEVDENENDDDEDVILEVEEEEEEDRIIKDPQGRKYVQVKPGRKIKPGKKVIKGNDGKNYVEIDDKEEEEIKREKEEPVIVDDKPTVKDTKGREYVEIKPGEKAKPGQKVIKGKNGKEYVKVEEPTIKDSQGKTYVQVKPGRKIKPGKKIIKGNDGNDYVEYDENDRKEEEEELKKEEPILVDDKPTVKDNRGREYVEVKPGDKIKPGDKVIKGKNGKEYVKVKSEEKRNTQPIIKDSEGRQYKPIKAGESIKPGRKVVKGNDGKQYVEVTPEEAEKYEKEQEEREEGEDNYDDGELMVSPLESVVSVVESKQTGQKIKLLPNQTIIQGKDGEKYIEIQPGSQQQQQLLEGEKIIKDNNGKQYIVVNTKSRRESSVSDNASPTSRRVSINSYKRVSTQMNTLVIGDPEEGGDVYVNNNIFLPQPSGILNKAKVASETQTSARRVSLLKQPTQPNTVSTTQIVVPFVEQPNVSKRQSQIDEYESKLLRSPSQSHSVSPSPTRRLSITTLDPEQIKPIEKPIEREPTVIEKQNPLIHFAHDDEEEEYEPYNPDSMLKTMGINPRYYESNKKLLNQRIKEKVKDEPLIDIPGEKEIINNSRIPANRIPLKPKTVNLSLGAMAQPAVVVMQQQFKRLDPIFNSVVRKLKDLNNIHKRAVIKAQSKIKKLQNITAQQNLAIRQLQYEIQQRDRAILEIGTEEVAQSYQKHINQTKEKKTAMSFQVLYEKLLFHKLEIEYDETTDEKERTAIERYGQTLLQSTAEHIKECKRLKRELDNQNKQLKNIQKNKNFNEIIYGNQVNDLYTPKMQPKKSPSHFNQNEEYIPIQYPPPEPELPSVVVGRGLHRLPPMQKYEKMRSLADSKSYSLPQLNYIRETEIALSPIKPRPAFKPYGSKAAKRLHPLTSSVFSPMTFDKREKLPPTLKKKPYIDF